MAPRFILSVAEETSWWYLNSQALSFGIVLRWSYLILHSIIKKFVGIFYQIPSASGSLWDLSLMDSVIPARLLMGVPDLHIAILCGLQFRDLSFIILDAIKDFKKCEFSESLIWNPIRGLPLMDLFLIHWTRMESLFSQYFASLLMLTAVVIMERSLTPRPPAFTFHL